MIIPTTASSIDTVVDLNRCPIGETDFTNRCKKELDENGVLVLPNFLTPQAIARIVSEGVEQ